MCTVEHLGHSVCSLVLYDFMNVFILAIFLYGKFLLEYEYSFQTQMGQISHKLACYAGNTSFIKTNYIHQNRQVYKKLKHIDKKEFF